MPYASLADRRKVPAKACESAVSVRVWLASGYLRRRGPMIHGGTETTIQCGRHEISVISPADPTFDVSIYETLR